MWRQLPRIESTAPSRDYIKRRQKINHRRLPLTTLQANHADPSVGSRIPLSAPVDYAHTTGYALRLLRRGGGGAPSRGMGHLFAPPQIKPP